MKREQPAPSTHAHLQPLQLVPTAQRGSGQPARTNCEFVQRGKGRRRKNTDKHAATPPPPPPPPGYSKRRCSPSLGSPSLPPPLAPSTRVSCVAKIGPLSSEESNKLAGKGHGLQGSRSGLAVRTSIRFRFGSPFLSKLVVCEHYCLVTFPITFNETLKRLSLLPTSCRSPFGVVTV